MALYDLPDGVDVKVWPAAGTTLIGQAFWSKDDVLATSRVTNLIPGQTVIITGSVLLSALGLSGGDQTTITFGLRRFDSVDVLEQAALQTTFINRDVDQIGLNLALIEVFTVGDYMDLIVQQDGIAAGLTNVDIITTLQYWTLDFVL